MQKKTKYFRGKILRMLKYLVRPGTTWFYTQVYLAMTTNRIQVMNKPPCSGRVRNEFPWQSPTLQVEEEPRRRTQHNNNNKKNQGTLTAKKEDDTESTANKTMATVTSSYESEWDEYTVDGMMEPSILSNHAYGFGRRRWVKPARKRRTPAPQVCKKPHSNSTQQAISRHKQLREFL